MKKTEKTKILDEMNQKSEVMRDHAGTTFDVIKRNDIIAILDKYTD